MVWWYSIQSRIVPWASTNPTKWSMLMISWSPVTPMTLFLFSACFGCGFESKDHKSKQIRFWKIMHVFAGILCQSGRGKAQKESEAVRRYQEYVWCKHGFKTSSQRQARKETNMGSQKRDRGRETWHIQGETCRSLAHRQGQKQHETLNRSKPRHTVITNLTLNLCKLCSFGFKPTFTLSPAPLWASVELLFGSFVEWPGSQQPSNSNRSNLWKKENEKNKNEKNKANISKYIAIRCYKYKLKQYE